MCEVPLYRAMPRCPVSKSVWVSRLHRRGLLSTFTEAFKADLLKIVDWKLLSARD